jgi:hypothetical protein
MRLLNLTEPNVFLAKDIQTNQTISKLQLHMLLFTLILSVLLLLKLLPFTSLDCILNYSTFFDLLQHGQML